MSYEWKTYGMGLIYTPNEYKHETIARIFELWQEEFYYCFYQITSPFSPIPNGNEGFEMLDNLHELLLCAVEQEWL